MPFDYNSFIQGVWTGMRLSRAPGGRRPPVPSGKYILTESGEKVLTEKKVWEGDETRYAPEEWYEMYTSSQNEAKAKVRYLDFGIQVDFNNAVLFWAMVEFPGHYPQQRLVIAVPDEGQEHRPNYLEVYTRRIGYTRETLQQMVDLINSDLVYYEKINGFWCYLFNAAGSQYIVPWSEDTVWFQGTMSELEAYISEIDYLPMLTE